jgi:hypothetical protein
MMFRFGRRGRGVGRGPRVLLLVSLVALVIGLVASLTTAFVIPVRVVNSTRIVTEAVTASSLGLVEVLIVGIVLLVIGAGVGYFLRGRSRVEPRKNDEFIEKKKKRLSNAEYAQTSDGGVLEVVDDDDKTLFS